MEKAKWEGLDHDEQIRLLRNSSNEEIIARYEPPESIPAKSFERYIEEMRDFWQPDSLGDVQVVGEPPNKETLLGARRDLNRTEAVLELIDNSIDAWRRRREKYATDTAKTLKIWLNVDSEGRTLTYEDNAGGVSKEFHNNLVNPGHSETEVYQRSIGSYRTGGKKAIFKLAEDAKILTRYRDPDGYEDKAYSVHLDKAWLEDPIAYQFKVYPFSRLGEIESGHTRFAFRLAGDWGTEDQDDVRAEIRKTYSLLFVRNPDIQVFIGNQKEPLKPLSDLYRFSGAHNKKIDIRPQRVLFTTKVEVKKRKEEIIFEVVLGCRTTSAASQGEDRWGIDIYGNDRLFIANNQQELWQWYELPKPNPGHLVRGFINIIGPNVQVPWDTHKRHLTTDHETIRILRGKTIRDLFAAWKLVYSEIGSGAEIKETIKEPYGSWMDEEKQDVNVAFDQVVPIPPTKQLRTPLPDSIRKPKVETAKKGKTQLVDIKLKFTQQEFRNVCTALDVDRSAGDDNFTKKQLAEAIKTHLLSL